MCRPFTTAATRPESGEKRRDEICLERRKKRCEPCLSRLSTTDSRMPLSLGTVMKATQRPSGEIAGARPMPRRRGCLPLSVATYTTGSAVSACLT